MPKKSSNIKTLNNKSSINKIPQKNNVQPNNVMNTIKDAVIYSTVFSGKQRVFDNIFGNRKIDINVDNYCDKIKEKYNNDKNNQYIEEEYNKCFK